MDKALLLHSVLLAFLWLMLAGAYASIGPPSFAVNHELKNCQVFYLGDECTICSLPQGWIYIGDPLFAECPQGYTELQPQAILPECSKLKAGFCCSLANTGSNGDCNDLVVNPALEKCAFVETVDGCENLPAGWKFPDFNAEWNGLCPLGFKWINEVVECQPLNWRDDIEVVDNNPLYMAIVLVAMVFALLVVKKPRPWKFK
ncbi:MAG: hypothetical protein JW744_04935 [Candidatus Diapherotrites archaeon]|uniref:Uncharacterized protein n=1 Tax=Candidatus Iainarchaeum sp. TaxID=3101447 RepID=A0A939C978_9ARCH|nr:hypothetical protein [Candidatus Diapherotrites archaeon]